MEVVVVVANPCIVTTCQTTVRALHSSTGKPPQPHQVGAIPICEVRKLKKLEREVTQVTAQGPTTKKWRSWIKSYSCPRS